MQTMPRLILYRFNTIIVTTIVNLLFIRYKMKLPIAIKIRFVVLINCQHRVEKFYRSIFNHFLKTLYFENVVKKK